MQNVLARIVSLPLSLIGIGKPVPSQKRIAYDKRMAKFRQEQQQAEQEWTESRAEFLRQCLAGESVAPEAYQMLDHIKARREQRIMDRTYACLLEQ